MTLIVEDGTTVTNANTYVSGTTLTSYATARGITLVANPEILLLKAMDYLENLTFIGQRWTRDQPLQWPRAYVIIDDWWQDVESIPSQLTKGQMEIAIAIDQGNGPLIDVPREVRTKTVGPISVTYAQGTSALIVNRTIRNALYKIVDGFGGFVVSKA